ncbi:MAG TPA: hypothetical protein VN647_01280 [Nitrospira sp.]|nr:hypothetical protein [Nitrospira sp.]
MSSTLVPWHFLNPKGIPDISGYPREGAQVGELAGTISIQIPSDHR